MKIIAVGRNYTAHIKELANEMPEEPVIFMKPDTALLRKGADFYIPDFSTEINYEAELVYKINREGKHIAEKFASKYYEEVTVGIDFTARDLQSALKAKGLPWELSKAFDGAAAVGDFIPLQELPAELLFTLSLNGAVRQQGSSEMMLHNINKLIAYISRYITLKKGDLIYTGTPAGVGTVAAGDDITLELAGREVLRVHVK